MTVNVPEDLLCSKSHEYLLKEGDVYKVGLTDYAVEQLGDIVFVELPEADTAFEKGEIFGTIESVKAASEMYMPISGKVVEINEALLDEPELINNDMYEAGWIIKVQADDESELGEAMSYDKYKSFIEE